MASAVFNPAAAAYGAADIIDRARPFNGVGVGEQIITSVELLVEATAVISGETSYRLYLYSEEPASRYADNDAWDLLAKDREAYRGYVDLGTPVDLGSSLYVRADGVNAQVSVPASGILYGYLVTAGAFTATAFPRKVTIHTVPVV